MSPPRRPEPDLGTGAPHPRPTNGSSQPADGRVVQRMARDDRAADHRSTQTHTHPAGATASADAVEQVRRSITDIKHDVRMLKVVIDKQSMAIERIAAALEDLAGTEEE